MKLSIFAAMIVGSLATDHLTYNMGAGDKGGGGKGQDKQDNKASASMDMSYNQMSSDYSNTQASAGSGDMAAQGGSYDQMPASKSDTSGQGSSYGPMASGNAGMTADQGSAQSQAPSTGGTVHTVIVGGTGGLVYTPNTINAAVGDMVNFTFMSTNHTATQSTFDKPCVKMANGADSGFLPNPNNTVVPAPSFMFEIKNTAAIWFYCKQKTGNHCGKGMVFSINPTAEKSHEMFKQMAMQQNGTAAASISSSATTAQSSSTVTSNTMTTESAAPATTSAAVSTDVQLAVSTAASAANSPMATGSANLAQGSGQGSTGGVCSCTCLCGPAAFPPGAGVGNWGGFGGAMPAPWGAVQPPSPAPVAAGAAAAVAGPPGIAYR
ncbi:MAG: hypothetical protein M1816_005861 [Peltula sp. TS41687]|nr:MAG: hypothetical protein M1816_005861 [Peltula sp. TS41687]